MDINQFAVYQLKNGPETRQMRFRSYEKLQQSGIQVRYEYYREVYLGKMQRQDTPENIRERLQKKIPKSFDGHSLSVSDVIVLKNGIAVTAFSVEPTGFQEKPNLENELFQNAQRAFCQHQRSQGIAR